MCVPAPAARRALAEATERWPARSRASDGICPSQAHSLTNPTSDHERGMAFDLTHDPDNGCDAHRWAEELMLRGDPRVKYVISNRRIWNPSISPNWREYGGTNPHTKHMHVSLLDDARDNLDAWWETAVQPPHEEPAMQPTLIPNPAPRGAHGRPGWYRLMTGGKSPVVVAYNGAPLNRGWQEGSGTVWHVVHDHFLNVDVATAAISFSPVLDIGQDGNRIGVLSEDGGFTEVAVL